MQPLSTNVVAACFVLFLSGDIVAEVSTTTNNRSHKYKLFKPRYTASIRQNFFVDSNECFCNALSSTVNFTSLNVFMNSIEKVDFSSF